MIRFTNEDIKFSLKNKAILKNWLKTLAFEYQFKIGDLNYIFCSDEYLLNINQEYLNHDTLTDIVTFDLSETKGIIEGDIFISIERVKDNSEKFSTQSTEIYRVMAHGLLHLLGYKDKSTEEKEAMRKLEDLALEKLKLNECFTWNI